MPIQLEALELPLKVADTVFKAGIASAIAGVTAVVGVMGVAAKATFDWADDLDSLGDVMGGTNEELAALNFVARKSGVSVDTLSRGTVILEKGLVKANGQLDTTGKTLKNWGINVKDANGKLKDQTTLMGDIADKYGTFSTQQEKVNFLTEVFGKSGAELVDFFDTLASEGGIDAVTKKVQDLGLAIDPNRYEQFNRNLEELKLVGLGLAVSFTEKVMPSVEKFLGFLTDFAAKPDLGNLIKKLDTFAGTFVNNFANRIDDWVRGGGAERLSESLISWIDGVGDDSVTQSKLLFAAGRLVTALGNAFQQVDWTGIAAASGNKIVEFFDALEEPGTVGMRNFWTGLEVSMQEGVRVLFQSGYADSNQAVVAYWNNIEVTSTNAFRESWNRLEVQGTNSTRNFFNKLEVQGTALTRQWITALANAAVSSWGTFAGAMNTFEAQTDARLRLIAKTFFNRAVAWAAQMIQGFKDGQAGLLGFIQGLVNQINNVLKRIITSFTLSIKVPSWLGGGGSSGGYVAPPGTVGGKSPDERDKHAAGGSFMIPSSYGYEGFPLGAMDTASGGEKLRITPRNQADVMELGEASISRLAERLAFTLAPAMVKALNNR